MENKPLMTELLQAKVMLQKVIQTAGNAEIPKIKKHQIQMYLDYAHEIISRSIDTLSKLN